MADESCLQTGISDRDASCQPDKSEMDVQESSFLPNQREHVFCL